jgi:mono/diheme cytochrome c family protein
VRIGIVVAGVVGFGFGVVCALACKPGGETSAVEKGKLVYAANCTACHNADPSKEGTIGPAIAGSSLELVRARVMKAEYPPGYTPKRDSHLMPAQPFLSADVPDLAAYLGSVGSGAGAGE